MGNFLGERQCTKQFQLLVILFSHLKLMTFTNEEMGIYKGLITDSKWLPLLLNSTARFEPQFLCLHSPYSQKNVNTKVLESDCVVNVFICELLIIIIIPTLDNCCENKISEYGFYNDKVWRMVNVQETLATSIFV